MFYGDSVITKRIWYQYTFDYILYNESKKHHSFSCETVSNISTHLLQKGTSYYIFSMVDHALLSPLKDSNQDLFPFALPGKIAQMQYITELG